MRELIKSLSKLKLNYELGKKTWFGTGGSTTLFLEVHSKSSLKKIIKLLAYNFPIFIVGAGSNLIVRDGGFKGLTLKLTDEFNKDIGDWLERYGNTPTGIGRILVKINSASWVLRQPHIT